MDKTDIIAAVAALTSLCAAAASGYISLRGQRRQYFGELRKWADEACDRLSEAVHACDLDPAKQQPNDFFMVRHELRCALSSLIDRGRWFFPNLRHYELGFDENKALKGVRQPALDHLVAAYRLVSRFDRSRQGPNYEKREQLVELKRKFVEVIQRYLDPSTSRHIFVQLTKFTGLTEDHTEHG